jgi:6-phosphogluconate dehydrogenase
MQIGMIGLGKMGGNMAERLRRAGHEVVGYDHHAEKRDVASLAELADRLPAPRAVWVMVPAGDPTRQTINELMGVLQTGDLVIDGGNSHYVDDQDHAKTLGEAGIHFIDAGVSGGGLRTARSDRRRDRCRRCLLQLAGRHGDPLLATRPALQGA